jgi:hypothetical protein
MKTMLTLLSICLAFSAMAVEKKDIKYVGFSSIDVTPAIGTPLGGHGGPERRLKAFLDWRRQWKYASFMKPSEGVLDPIRSKAMVIKNSRVTYAIVSFDAVGVTYDVYQDILKRVKPHGIDEIILTATHTHNGPGALTKRFLWQVIAMDRFQPEIYEYVTNGITQSILDAAKNLTPQTLHSSNFKPKNVAKNRRNKEAPIDETAHFLFAKNTKGEITGGIINYGIHGTAHSAANLLFSADVSGGIERHIEKQIMKMQPNSKRPTFLFINGAEGDVNPVHKRHKGIEKTGQIFASYIPQAVNNALEVKDSWNIRKIRTKLPRGRFNLRNCKATKRKIVIPLTNRLLPRWAHLFQIQLGDIMIFTWPGEPTAALGLQTKAMARELGIKDPWVFSLANGHMAYFTTPDQYDVPSYESCVALHGKHAGKQILNTHKRVFSDNGRKKK